ncbi:hypothetical protein [Meridianimarinicoccus aquatilis]|uniref:hypothetical protein n=1 Tax=Meridianimarinicoccus aquatilis TaxID=2552766 RepID=UPI001AA0B09B|nr:hypothetical protein [Fluviibacterium aquatile]
MSKALAALAASFVGFVVVARVIFPLPDISPREVSAAIPADPETHLGASFVDAADRQPGLSGVIPLKADRMRLQAG